MVHFFGIFTPAKRKADADQQAFFSEPSLSKAEADAELLTGKAPPQPDHRLDDRDPSLASTRFVSLLSPPFI